MQEIRVEITPEDNGNSLSLLATIGDRDVSDHVLRQPMVAFRSYLPPELRNYTRPAQQRGTTLQTYLSGSSYGFTHRGNPLPPSALADAIRCYLTEIAPTLNGESTVSEIMGDMDIAENLAASQPSFLSIGGKLFRLNAIAESGAPVKLLNRMRKSAAQAIAMQRIALLAAAQREAVIIRQQAEVEMAAVQRQRIEFAQARGRELAIPSWVGNIPVKRVHDGLIAVQGVINFCPLKFTWPDWSIPNLGEDNEEIAPPRKVNLEWPAIPAGMVKVPFWIAFNPVDGSFQLENARLDQYGLKLPHADYSGFCCQPQGLPERLASLDDLVRIEVMINRAFKEVNLSSLLVREYNLSPAVRAFVPPQVGEFMTEWDRKGDYFDPTSYHPMIVEREAPGVIWTQEGTTRRR